MSDPPKVWLSFRTRDLSDLEHPQGLWDSLSRLRLKTNEIEIPYFVGHGASIRLPEYLDSWQIAYVPRFPATTFQAAEAVARTCWTLWKDQPQRIWNLVTEWTNEGGATEIASFQILVTGFELGHLSSESGIETLGGWLLEDSPRSKAASRLLPLILASMPEDWNAAQLQNWLDHSQPHLLRDIVVRFFSMQPRPCLQLFLIWAKDEDHRFDGLFIDCVSQLPTPEFASATEYKMVEARFRHLRLLVGKRNPRLTRLIEKFLQRLHGAAGKSANEPPRRRSSPGRGSEASPKGRPRR